MGIIGQVVAMILIGPSKVLGMKPNIPSVFAGLSLDGFFAAFTFVCVIPGVTEEIKKDR